MSHDWIFDVLSDLHAYATRNDMPGLAARVLEALVAARREIAAADDGPEEPPQTPPAGCRVH
jgi:hypothetical protein